MRWKIYHFKELVHDDKFISDNMFHMEYVWFIHAQFIQTESDKVKQEWNYYKKNIFKNCQSSGIPNTYIIFLNLKVLLPYVVMLLNLLLQML